MGIIFQNGIGIGTAPGNVVGNIWDPQYKGGALSIYPDVLTDLNNPGYNGITIYNSSIADAYAPGTYAALAKTAISTGQKYMITFGLDFDAENTEPNYWLGFGTRSIDLYNYLGSNDNSVGIGNNGAVYYGGTTIYSSLPTFGTVGDIIDVAIDGNNYIWYRVNGGDWNGNNTADPATNNGGLDISTLFGGATLYSAIALFGGSGPSVFSVYDVSPYGIPNGFTQIAGDRPGAPTFTLTSSDISNGYSYNTWNGFQYAEPQGTNGVDGFIVPIHPGEPTTIKYASNAPYAAQISSQAIVDFFYNLTINNILSYAHETTIWNVQWGPGSTYPTGVVSLQGVGSVGNQMNIAPLNTNDPTWNQPGNNTQTLHGIYNFPATFTLILPTFNKGGWC